MTILNEDKPKKKEVHLMAIYDCTATAINGEERSLSEYKGKVLLIVNTASKCGYAPQFAGLQTLYDKYHSQQFAVLGFPSNQFAQELRSNKETAQFCELHYQVTFPMFARVNVNGRNAHPLFKYLTQQAPGILGSKSIKWNFTKFLVDGSGRVVKRYAPKITPEHIEADIVSLLD